MRENRLSGLEGGGADTRSPYPYQNAGADFEALVLAKLVECGRPLPLWLA